MPSLANRPTHQTLPSSLDGWRRVLGGRTSACGTKLYIPDPFDPKPGKHPYTLWLTTGENDGFRVADPSKRIDDLRLKDKCRDMAGTPFVPRRQHSARRAARGPQRPRTDPVEDGRNGGGGAKEPRPLLTIHDADELLGGQIPPRRWHVEDWLPADDVTLLGADGGEGKTQLALQLAWGTTRHFPWLGNPVRAGSAIYYTAEETKDEMAYRLDRIKAAIALGDGETYPLKIVSRADDDAVLAVPGKNGAMEPTPLLGELEQLVADTEARLLVLDAVADCYGGDEIVRPQVRSFVRLLRRIAIGRDCAVLLLAHPSVDAMKNNRGYSGSTAWNNSVRSRLYLTTPKGGEADPDLREMERQKSNRARRGAKIMTRWRDGYFMVESPAAAATAINVGAAKTTFLTLLAAYTFDKRACSHNPASRNFAPRLFAQDARAGGISEAAFSRAMNALFQEKQISVEEYGRPARPNSRLVVASVGSE